MTTDASTSSATSEFPTTRLAMISGTGTGLKRIIPAIAATPQISVVAVHGRDTARLGDVRDRLPGIRLYSDVEEMLRAGGYDAVYIGSPPFLHAEHIELAARYSRYILCEKPVAPNLADADRIQHVLDRSGVTLAIAHHLRHQAAVRHMAGVLRDGSMGRLVAAFAQWHFPLDINSRNAQWKLDAVLGGGPLLDVGIHCIDILDYLLGEPVAVTAAPKARQSTVAAGLWLRYADDALAAVSASWLGQSHGNDLVLVTDQVKIRAAQFFSESSCRFLEVWRPRANPPEVIEFPTRDLYADQMVWFSRLVTGQGCVEELETGTSLSSSIRSLRIALV